MKMATIQGRKPSKNAVLRRIANTKVRPVLIPKGQEAQPRDSKLPFTSASQPYTHVWVTPKGEDAE
jgi:hypothetical protein